MSAYFNADRIARSGGQSLRASVLDDLNAVSHHIHVLGLGHTDGALMLVHARATARGTGGWAADATILDDLSTAVDELYGELPVVDSLRVRRVDDLLHRLRDNLDALLERAYTLETTEGRVA